MSRTYLDNLQVPEFILKDNPSCAEVDPDLFFPQELESVDGRVRNVYPNLAEAKEVCRSCPLALDCLEFALKNGEIGIWGGTTEEQGQALRRKTGIRGVKKYKTPFTW